MFLQIGKRKIQIDSKQDFIKFYQDKDKFYYYSLDPKKLSFLKKNKSILRIELNNIIVSKMSTFNYISGALHTKNSTYYLFKPWTKNKNTIFKVDTYEND